MRDRGLWLVLGALLVVGLVAGGAVWWHEHQQTRGAECLAFSQAFGGGC